MQLSLTRLTAPYHFTISDEAGHAVQTDASVELGGGDRALRPMQLLLAGLASCSSIDVVMLLEKMRQPLGDIQVDIRAERREGEIPSLFERIHLCFRLRGAIDAGKARQAIALSMEKYCSVAKILERSCTITWDFEMLPA